MRDMKFRVLIEYDPVAESYSAICPDLPGCASAGDTEDKAQVNIVEAIRLYLEPVDIPIPESAKLVEVASSGNPQTGHRCLSPRQNLTVGHEEGDYRRERDSRPGPPPAAGTSR